MKGRKLHALVDTEGFPLRVIVHSAAIQDRDGAALVLDKIRGSFPWLELVWADGIYNLYQSPRTVTQEGDSRRGAECDSYRGEQQDVRHGRSPRAALGGDGC